MIPGAFDYHAPETLEEALSLLDRYGDDAKILAGGQSLIPAMRFRLAVPGVLIDINRIAELRPIRAEGGGLVLGAMARESELEKWPGLDLDHPLLSDAAGVIADPLVRNRATVGGNVAHADPANDHPAVMLALGAEIRARGPRGERRIPIDDFFTGFFENALAPGEILTEIRVPPQPVGAGGAYVKVERKVGDYAVSAVAVQIEMEGTTCRRARIGMTNVNPVSMRADQAEAALQDRELSPQVLEEAGRAAASQCDPSADLRGSVEYKRDLTRVLTKRAVRSAARRAAGGAR